MHALSENLMAYATITHLLYHNPARPTYTATSVPNASAAVMYLDEAAAELDFALTRGGYDSPLLSSAASSVKAYFQKANAYGALWMIESGAQVGHNRDEYQSFFVNALKLISNSELPGLDRNAEQSIPRFDGSATPPFFTRDTQF